MKDPIIITRLWLKQIKEAALNKVNQTILLPMKDLLALYLHKAVLTYSIAHTNWAVQKNWLQNILKDKKAELPLNNNKLGKVNQRRLNIVIRHLNAAHLKSPPPEITRPKTQPEHDHLLTAAHEAKLPSMHFQAAHDNVTLLSKIYHQDPQKALLQDSNGNLPIHIAAINGAINNTKFLLKNNLFMLKKGNNAYNTALHLAILHEHFDIADQILTVSNADNDVFNFIMRHKNNYQHQPLHLALLTKNEALVKRILLLITASVQEDPLHNLSDLLLNEDKFGNSILKLILISENNNIIKTFLTTINIFEAAFKEQIEKTTDIDKKFFIKELKNLTETLQLQQEKFSQEELNYNEQL